jgi:flagellar hook assembly protein FlgD
LIELNDTGVVCFQNSSPLLLRNTVTLNSYNGIEITSSTTSQDKNPRPVLLSNSIFTNATSGASSYYNLYTYYFYQPSANTINAVSNWWGTADTNLVRKSIYYYSNSPSYSPFVSFVPVLGSNVNYTAYGATNSALWFSPNGDGIQDTVTIYSAITHATAWSVAVVNDAGANVRTFTGSGTAISSTWNGLDQLGSPVPEGGYRTVITATNLADGRISVAYGDFSVVDRTSPAGSAVANTLTDGTVANQLVLTGTASDASFVGYVVDYGAGTNPVSFTLLTSNSVPVSGGILGQLDSLALTNGVYTFRLRVYDRAGNVTTTRLVVTIDNVRITNADAANVFFDPAAGSTAITFGLNKTSDLTLTISPVTVTADAAGNLSVSLGTVPIRTISQHASPGAISIPWDGRDNSGTVVPNASYVFRILARSDLGRTNAYDPSYVPGLVNSTSNSISTNFSFQANDPIAITYNLYAPAYVGLGLASPVSGNIFAGTPREAGVHTEYWNGRVPSTHQVIYGPFQLNLLTQVMPENAIAVNHQTPAIIGSLQTESYLITPTYSEVSVIYYTLQRRANVTLWLLDPNGNSISLLDQSGQAAGSYSFEWNGWVDSASVAAVAGDYEVHLDVTDSITGGSQSTIGNLSIRR